MKSKIKSLIKDTFIFGLGVLGSKIILFLLVPLYTNVLTESEYGIADLIVTLEQLLLPFISLATYNGLLRYGMMKKYKKEDALLCSSIMFIIGVILTILLIPIFNLFGILTKWKVYLVIYIISMFFYTNSFVYLKIKEKNKVYATLGICKTLLLCMLNILLLLIFKTGIKGYILSNIISTVIISIFAFTYGNQLTDLKKANFNKKLFKLIVVFSIPFIFNDLSWWIINSSDKIMINILMGSSYLGIYTVSSKIPALINTIGTIFTQAWSISSIKEFEKENSCEFYTKIFKYYYIILFGSCICFNCFIKSFMTIYVGKNFFESWQYVPLLILSAVFVALSSFMGSLYSAIKKSKNIMMTAIIGAIINIVVNYILIIRIGIFGAVIGTVIAQLFILTSRMIDIRKYLQINYENTKFIFLIIVSCFQATLISLNINIYLVSIIASVIFLIVVRKDMINIIKILYNHILKKRGKNGKEEK